MNFEERFKNRAVYVTRDGLHKSILDQTNLAVNAIKRPAPDDSAFTRKAINQQLGLEATPGKQENEEANALWSENLGVQNYIMHQQKRQQPEDSLPYYKKQLFRNLQQPSQQQLNYPSPQKALGNSTTNLQNLQNQPNQQNQQNQPMRRQMSLDDLYGSRKLPQKQPEKIITAKEFLENYSNGKPSAIQKSNHLGNVNQFYQAQLQQLQQPNYSQLSQSHQHQQQQNPQQQPQDAHYAQNHRQDYQMEPQQQYTPEYGANRMHPHNDHESYIPSGNNYDVNKQYSNQEMEDHFPNNGDYYNEGGEHEHRQNANIRRYNSMSELHPNNVSYTEQGYQGKGYQQIYQEKLQNGKHNISQDAEFKPTIPISPKFFTKQRADERAEIKRMKESIEQSQYKVRTRRTKPVEDPNPNQHQLEMPQPFDRGNHLLYVGESYLNDISPKHQEFYVKNFNVDPKQFIEPASILEQYAVPASQDRHQEDPRLNQPNEHLRKNLAEPMRHHSNSHGHNRRQSSPRGNNRVLFHDSGHQNERKKGQEPRYLTPQPARSVEFRPYTLKEYKTFQESSGVKNKLGGLGKNIGGDDWQRGFDALNKMKNFAHNANLNNLERLPALSHRSYEKAKSAEGSMAKAGALRKKALEFAKQIPLPEPKKLFRYTSESENGYSRPGLDDADDINSRNLEIFENKRQYYRESVQKIK